MPLVLFLCSLFVRFVVWENRIHCGNGFGLRLSKSGNPFVLLIEANFNIRHIVINKCDVEWEEKMLALLCQWGKEKWKWNAFVRNTHDSISINQDVHFFPFKKSQIKSNFSFRFVSWIRLVDSLPSTSPDFMKKIITRRVQGWTRSKWKGTKLNLLLC